MSAPARTQEARKAESERKIIKAAGELFARQGYTGTTLADIGKRAGYTGGLVSHRFGSKEELLKAVVSRATQRYVSDQLEPALSEGSAEDALRSYIEVYLNEVSVRESRMRTLYVVMGEALGAVPEIADEIAGLNRSIRRYIERIIQRGIDAGEFRRDLKPARSAVLILGLLRGITMQYLADRKAFDPKALVGPVVTSALAGLKE